MVKVAKSSGATSENTPSLNCLPPLSSRIQALPQAIDDDLRRIGINRSERGLPVYPMFTSLVTSVVPQISHSLSRRPILEAAGEPGPLQGDPALRTAIAESRQFQFGAKLSAENVVITGGARDALHGAIVAMTDPGSVVVVMPPFFRRFLGTIEANGARAYAVPLCSQAGFQPNLAKIEAEWHPRTRAILVTTPNNPTGTAVTAGNLKELQLLARRYSASLIIDETFEAFDFYSQAREHPKFDIRNTILIGSFTETFSLGGMKAGYLIASRDIAAQVAQVGNYVSIGCESFVQGIVTEMMHHRQSHLAEVIPMIRQRHTMMSQALRCNPAIKSVHGEGGTFVWAIPGREQQIDCRATALKLARDFGVLIKPGAEYGASGCFRVGLGQIKEQKNFENACHVLADFSGWEERKEGDAIPLPPSNADPYWSSKLKLPSSLTHLQALRVSPPL